MGPYNNGCTNAKFLAIISVYWPGLHELFPTCCDSETVCETEGMCTVYCENVSMCTTTSSPLVCTHLSGDNG